MKNPFDKRLYSAGGALRSSYGPRHIDHRPDGTFRLKHVSPEDATIWVVYTHKAGVAAVWEANCRTKQAAAALADELNGAGDPLTIAYMAMGAALFCNKNDEPAFKNMGELDGLAEIIRFAGDLDALVENHATELDGVFVYEVAEPFGLWAAEHLATTGCSSINREAAEAKMKELAAEIFLTDKLNRAGDPSTPGLTLDYLVRHAPQGLESSCYIEIGPGRYAGKHWQEGFAFVPEDAFFFAEGVVSFHFPEYDRHAMNEMPSDTALAVAADLRAAMPHLGNIDVAIKSLRLFQSCNMLFRSELRTESDAIESMLEQIALALESSARDQEWVSILGM